MKRSVAKGIFLSMLFLASVTSVCAQASDSRAKTITFAALKGPSGIGMIKLFDSPPIAAGSVVQMVAVPNADLMAAKVISGEYDVAVLPINMAAKLRSAGIPIVLAAVVGDGMVSFLTSDSSIHSLSDLKGKEIYIAGQGATPDFLMQRLLSKAGLNLAKDLHLSYSLPYPEMAAALAGGKIQYAVLPEPFATLALSANPSLTSPLNIDDLWLSATGQASYPMTALIVDSRLAADKPEAVRALLFAVASSVEWVTSHPSEAGILVEKHDLGLKAKIAEKAIPRSAYVFEKSKEARPAIEALLTVFLETSPSSIGGRLPDDGFYANF